MLSIASVAQSGLQDSIQQFAVATSQLSLAALEAENDAEPTNELLDGSGVSFQFKNDGLDAELASNLYELKTAEYAISANRQALGSSELLIGSLVDIFS